MTEFLVELYVSRAGAGDLDRCAERIHLAATELSREGTPVRYLRRIFIPQDETCLLLYEADSPDVVREATRRADVPFERVVEALAGSDREKPSGRDRTDTDQTRSRRAAQVHAPEGG